MNSPEPKHVPIKRHEVYAVLIFLALMFAYAVHHDPSALNAPAPAQAQDYSYATHTSPFQ